MLCDVRLLNEFLETEYLEKTPSWCWQVNGGNGGNRYVSYAVLWVKDDWKGQFKGMCFSLSKLRSLPSFSVRYDVTQ
jgi:hypothetical protein